uniref:Retrovirus-related Pol polyprotein from transposon TNT 1-94 n=1 Tax=Cajanus cajan TaxID=3821 RepID=A0A151SZ64_CAJCA|nr:Retrovirus-related Pol polyprotein from transposon TNT 1-94 [Cajanus cajan]
MHKKRYSKISNSNIYGPKSIWVPNTKIILVADLFNKKKKSLTILEEVYVSQPPGFEGYLLPSHVFKLNKALYGLKQAPRKWYDKLSSILISNNFIRGKIGSTLFRKVLKDDFIIVQIYVDDIIFGATNDDLCQEFSKPMQDEFEMSMMGEIKLFLGL